MSKRQKKFWIKERHNPQLGVYYVACGQMSKAAAGRAGKSLYGSNIMVPFDNEVDYNARLAELQEKGKRVHIR